MTLKEVKLRYLKDGQYYYVWGLMADITRPEDRSQLRCDICQWIAVAGNRYLLYSHTRMSRDWLQRHKYIRFFGPIPMPTLAELEENT
jgi:hypothetical protein